MEFGFNKYLFKVRKFDFRSNDYKWFYFVLSGDPFHIMGEYIFRSFENVESISFSVWTASREKFWQELTDACKVDFFLKYN